MTDAMMSSLLRRNEALEARLAVAREALGGIASCEKRADGDVVDVARQALKELDND